MICTLTDFVRTKLLFVNCVALGHWETTCLNIPELRKKERYSEG